MTATPIPRSSAAYLFYDLFEQHKKSNPGLKYQSPNDSELTFMSTTTKRQPKFHPYMNEMTVEVKREYTGMDGTGRPVQMIQGKDKKGRSFSVPAAWLQPAEKPEPADGSIRHTTGGRVIVRVDGQAQYYDTVFLTTRIDPAHWFFPGQTNGYTWEYVKKNFL